MRKLYALGLQITTVGPNDGNGLFAHFLIANGGIDIVTRDGKLHTDDPKVREAVQTFSGKMDALTEKQVNEFEHGVPSAKVVRIPNANHYVFLSNEADTLREMKVQHIAPASASTASSAAA